MKRYILCTIFSILSFVSSAQKQQRLSIETNYGINGNFFVRSYDENGFSGTKNFFKKNFLGSISGVEIRYKTGPRSAITIGYARAINKKNINYDSAFNSVYLFVKDFSIRHINNFYQLYYDRRLQEKTNNFTCAIGLFYLRMSQQEIELLYPGNEIIFEERNFKNSKLEEGGVFAGLEYSKKIDTRFEFGIKSRFYYLISTGAPEAITLTPLIRYYF